MTLVYLILGTVFGFILSRSGAADYGFIQVMFLFTEFQLYGIVLLNHLAFTVVLRDGRFGDESADLHLQISMARMHGLEFLG